MKNGINLLFFLWARDTIYIIRYDDDHYGTGSLFIEEVYTYGKVEKCKWDEKIS